MVKADIYKETYWQKLPDLEKLGQSGKAQKDEEQQEMKGRGKK